MSTATMLLLMMAQQNQRRLMEESRRRREEEERRRKKRQEEERKKEEEYQKMVKHRKTSPVVYNEEEWQRERCLKAFSMQPSVQNLVSKIDEVRPTIIEEEEEKLDQKIIETGYRYSFGRSQLDEDIETLKSLGISIRGEQYQLSRLVPTNTNMAVVEKINEFMGTTFTIDDGQPIEINPRILEDSKYYQRRYEELNPEEVERDFTETTARMRKYQSIGKYLRFLLKTNKYLTLETHSERITAEHEECELRKKEMQSFQSLTKEQLLVIQSYFKHLGELTDISVEIEKLFRKKDSLKLSSNEEVTVLTVERVLSSEEYNELITQVIEYMDKIKSNDEETMREAYELVKGEYPIDIDRRHIYDLIVEKTKDYKSEKPKKLSRTVK